MFFTVNTLNLFLVFVAVTWFLQMVQDLLNILPPGRGGIAQQHQGMPGAREPVLGRFLLPVAECR